MAVRRHKTSSLAGGILKRIARSFFAVIVLTAFVLLLSLFIKGLASADYANLSLNKLPLIHKLGFDTLGDVAGAFNINIETKEASVSTPSKSNDNSVKASENENKEVKFRVAIVSDSHESNTNLKKALDIAKEKEVKTIFHLGDLTDFGVIAALNEAKKVLDSSKLTYYPLPGDHDLWQTVGPQNFLEVFKKNYQTVSIEGVKFVLLDNSANYTPIEEKELTWFKAELADADYVLLSQPLYHPYIKIYMGVVNGEDQPEMLTQASELLELIRGSHVQAIIAGDQHNMSVYPDPKKPELQHIAVGALAEERNLQTPRFFILKINTDKTFSIDEKIL